MYLTSIKDDIPNDNSSKAKIMKEYIGIAIYFTIKKTSFWWKKLDKKIKIKILFKYHGRNFFCI